MAINAYNTKLKYDKCAKQIVQDTTDWGFKYTPESLRIQIKNWRALVNKKLEPVRGTGAGAEEMVRSTLQDWEYIVFECLVQAKRNPLYKVSK